MQPEDDLQVQDVGEAGVLEAIGRIVARPDPEVLVGMGDDAAVLWPRTGRHVVATTDIQVEGVHFRSDLAGPGDVGWRALAVNLSDVAAMGGIPRHALVSLTVPPTLSLRWIEDFYRGLEELGALFGVTVVGGNLAAILGPIIADVTVLGEVEADLLLRRVGARAGDLLVVTGTLGASAAALLAWEHRLTLPEGERLLAAHRRPMPRVHEGRAAARSRWARAMIDLSDGLSTDLLRLCDANHLGVRLEGAAVPVDPALGDVASRLNLTPLDLALCGGEDYELLMAADRQHAEELAQLIREETGTAATVIGEMVPPDEGRVVQREGRHLPLEPLGWDHFRPSTTPKPVQRLS
ncbi:MAG: thiamine-phosphate kinase [Armatimonadota bacterium]|nr:thiamine-phosphate kinase [Armatimonadota bacterium]MDR7465374.1 thiamine-phosphate kinase [Armatimonadota bacterium]MDR7474839.1 thiamine-phosphate kinase [Armatimonadota bacterium]MDR7538544.1 thiamine-phosphate kinase [Armatimonadota bacterium]